MRLCGNQEDVNPQILRFDVYLSGFRRPTIYECSLIVPISKTLSPTEIRDAIAATKDFNGVTGKITIDNNRNASKSAVVVKVDGTSNRYVTTINP